jgi:hypothetical protein
MTKQEIAAQALANATQSASLANYPTIYEQFEQRGIPAADIRPRENVFTYNAWLALGRQVRRGEHGVKVVTWIDMTKKNEAGEKQDIGRKPRTVAVFHISQTDAIN